jgi:hypothetical protein
MRRVLAGIGIVLGSLTAIIVIGAATLAALGPEGRSALLLRLMSDDLAPAPDYASPDAWAALPGRADRADTTLLPGTTDDQPTAAADVFYVHAASNLTLQWNASVDRRTARFLVDGPYMERFASVFNGCCRIYAPRYRQQALGGPQGARFDRATDVAYADVRNAFRHYLSHWNEGRPIIIAGSQAGGRHALRLLIDDFAGQRLRAQLVAAYLVGASIDAERRAELDDIPICDGAEQTGCVNVWNAAGRQARERLEALARDGAESRDAACVNPLSWRADSEPVPRERNRGSISSSGWYDAPVDVHVGLVDAQCEGGWLWVTPPSFAADLWQPFGPGDYHIYNYALFYADLRENATLRVRHFVATPP